MKAKRNIKQSFIRNCFNKLNSKFACLDFQKAKVFDAFLPNHLLTFFLKKIATRRAKPEQGREAFFCFNFINPQVSSNTWGYGRVRLFISFFNKAFSSC
jgi:hypothetical protein